MKPPPFPKLFTWQGTCAHRWPLDSRGVLCSHDVTGVGSSHGDHSERTQRLEAKEPCQRQFSRAGTANTTLARRFSIPYPNCPCTFWVCVSRSTPTGSRRVLCSSCPQNFPCFGLHQWPKGTWTGSLLEGTGLKDALPHSMECTARGFLPPLQSQQTDQPQTVGMSDPLGQVLASVRSIPLHLHHLAKHTQL